MKHQTAINDDDFWAIHMGWSIQTQFIQKAVDSNSSFIQIKIVDRDSKVVITSGRLCNEWSEAAETKARQRALEFLYLKEYANTPYSQPVRFDDRIRMKIPLND